MIRSSGMVEVRFRTPAALRFMLSAIVVLSDAVTTLAAESGYLQNALDFTGELIQDAQDPKDPSKAVQRDLKAAWDHLTTTEADREYNARQLRKRIEEKAAKAKAEREALDADAKEREAFLNQATPILDKFLDESSPERQQQKQAAQQAYDDYNRRYSEVMNGRASAAELANFRQMIKDNPTPWLDHQAKQQLDETLGQLIEVQQAEESAPSSTPKPPATPPPMPVDVAQQQQQQQEALLEELIRAALERQKQERKKIDGFIEDLKKEAERQPPAEPPSPPVSVPERPEPPPAETPPSDPSPAGDTTRKPNDREKDLAMELIMKMLDDGPAGPSQPMNVRPTVDQINAMRERRNAQPQITGLDNIPGVVGFLPLGTDPDADMEKYRNMAQQALADGDGNYLQRATAINSALARQEAASAAARQALYDRQQAMLAEQRRQRQEEERRRQQQLAQQQAAQQQAAQQQAAAGRRQPRYFIYPEAGSGDGWNAGGWDGGVIDWGGGDWGVGGWDGGGWGGGSHDPGMLFDPPQ